MKKRKGADKIIVAIVAAMVFGFFGTISAQASNWQDQYYNLRYSGDGGDVYTGWYAKTDDTSVYIKHDGDVNVWLSIRVQGSNKNFTWDGRAVQPPIGVGYKMYNNVWETYGRPVNVRLELTPQTHTPCWLHGAWSPDSI